MLHEMDAVIAAWMKAQETVPAPDWEALADALIRAHRERANEEDTDSDA